MDDGKRLTALSGHAMTSIKVVQLNNKSSQKDNSDAPKAFHV
jgi:hypothetical protein